MIRKIASWALACFITAALAGEWHIETVDSDGEVGSYTAICLDWDGNPHIAYYDYTNQDLKYSYWNGSSWIIEVVETSDDYYNHISIDYGYYGGPCVGYSGTDEDAYFAYKFNDEWRVRLVDSPGASVSMKLDMYGNIHIAYYPILWGLNYAYNFSIENVEEFDDAGEGTSIAVDANSWPHISYQEVNYLHTLGWLKYARWNGSTWEIETIYDGYDLYGERSSIALDSSSRPHIVHYVGSPDFLLRYAYKDGGWIGMTVDEDGNLGKICLSSNDIPFIVYQDPYYVRLARFFDDALWFEDIEAKGAYPSIIIDSNDQPHIAFYDTVNRELKYAWHEGIFSQFHLLEPENEEIVHTTSPELDWEDSPVPDHASYTLWWGTDPDFNDYNEVTGIGESEYQITEGIEDGDRIYWRVKSIDDQSEEYWAVEMDWYFDVDLGGGVDIVDFVADAEDEGVLVNWRIEGGAPAGLRVLRSVGDAEPVAIHHNPLPGSAVRWLDNQVEEGVEYCYWLEVTDNDGLVIRFGPTEPVTVPEYIPELILYAAYPNPSREVINFVFSLPEEGWVELSVYDLSGRRIVTLVDAEQTAGRHEIVWDCVEVGSGVYLYRLETLAGSITQRLVIAR